MEYLLAWRFPLYCFLRLLRTPWQYFYFHRLPRHRRKKTKAAFLPWSHCLSGTAVTWVYCASVFLPWFGKVGTIIFHNELSGSFIMVLCWLCPFMYLATTMGSIQNGLGKTGITFLQNMFAMGIRLVFVLFAVPLFGIRGYLWGFLVSELLLAFLCCFSVRRQVEFHCNMADCVLKPGLVLLISLGLELALCTAIPVNRQFLGNSIPYGYNNRLLWGIFRGDPQIKGR